MGLPPTREARVAATARQPACAQDGRVLLAPPRPCHPLSPPPASRWGVCGLGSGPLPPEDASCLPPRGPAAPPFSWHGSTALSGPFHHFGGYSVHILRWKYLKPVPTATPLDLPQRRAPCKWGPHVQRGRMETGPGCQECGGKPPRERGRLAGSSARARGESAASSSRLELPRGAPPGGGVRPAACARGGPGTRRQGTAGGGACGVPPTGLWGGPLCGLSSAPQDLPLGLPPLLPSHRLKGTETPSCDPGTPRAIHPDCGRPVGVHRVSFLRLLACVCLEITLETRSLETGPPDACSNSRKGVHSPWGRLVEDDFPGSAGSQWPWGHWDLPSQPPAPLLVPVYERPGDRSVPCLPLGFQMQGEVAWGLGVKPG